MKQVPLTASANTGIGLWTMICVGFSQIFGCQSKSLKRKQEKILNFANEIDENKTVSGAASILKRAINELKQYFNIYKLTL